MDNSPFAKLAPELRNRIYELTLQSQRAFVIKKTGQTSMKQVEQTHQRHPLGLALTCKLMRSESTRLFYAINTFVLARGIGPTEQGASILRLFRSIIAPISSDCFRSVIIDLGLKECDSWPYKHYRSGKFDQVLTQMLDEAKQHHECVFKVTVTIRYWAFYANARTVGVVERKIPVELDFSNVDRLWEKTFDDLRERSKSAEFLDDENQLQHIFSRLLACRRWLGDHSEIDLP